MISRRDFLQGLTRGVAGLALAHPIRAYVAETSPAIPGTTGMIVRSSRFLDLEMPREYANSFLTPVEHFFVRNHMHQPSTLDAAEWRLSVAGEVERPLTFTLADLRKLESHNVINTLECAGNGRAFVEPHVPGIQWQKGGVGNARFMGVRLSEILSRAGVKSTAKHVMFRGLDEVPGKVPPFIRSIPIEKATDPDTLIATHMNGASLTKHHGFPARALVPGWVGAASCKWLAEIKVLDKPFEGNFMNPGYRMPNTPLKPGDALTAENSHPVTALSVKSLIAKPSDGAKSKPGLIRVEGVAWAGEADVTRVDVSTDSGANWRPAQLAKQHSKYAWRLWSYSFKTPKPGDYTIMSRATDGLGRTQPQSVNWNPGGYLNNAIDQILVHVEG
ncbi:MAG TPA: molybdopterin-dependent oxidoreductase [Terriglobales bacterium]|nr:molybdopterin-dependent oxidoreductase [Terriglobales bacterium]